MKKYSFHVQGTHCKACKMLIEDILVEQKEITHASVNLNNRIVEIEGALNVDPEEFVKKLNPLLKEHGYALSTESNVAQKDLTPFYTAVPLGLLVLFLFFLLQKSGVIYFGFEGGLTPWTALLVGLIASVSTCLAVVGGLILSLSAKISQDVSNFRPFLFFHTGRVFAFALLGGVLGAIGSAISINHSITALLGLLAAFVMIILGINLLDILHITKRLQITLPETFFKKVSKIEQGIWAPLLVGAATFFLPCGFTQSMQIASLASSSWYQGATIMLMFALGTLPMLLLISFSSYKFSKSKFATIFYKTSGVVVVGLGVFAFLSGLAALGIIKPIFNI